MTTWTKILGIGILLLAGGLLAFVFRQPPAPAPMPEVKPFSYFASLSAAELQQTQAKLTYLGEQTVPVATTVCSSFFRLPKMEEFDPYRNAQGVYVNDFLPQIMTFTVSPEELEAILDTAEPILSDSASTAGPTVLSFTIVRTLHNDTEGNEILLNLDGSRKLVEGILNALSADNGIGRRALEPLRQNITF